MILAALILSILALLIALAAWARSAGGSTLADEGRADARRLVVNLAEEVEGEVGNIRRLLAAQAEGETLDREQILEGRLWRDLSPPAGLELFEAGGLEVLDVRTPQETATGVIPGAVEIPIEELSERLREVPGKGGRLLVCCAGGGRSAAACELLSREGFTGVHNLGGGMGSWTGPTEKPGTAPQETR